VGSAFGAFWEDPEDGFIKFAVKRASKQEQTLHMEGKLHVILYFRVVCGWKRIPEILWRNGLKASWTMFFFIFCQLFDISDYFSKWSAPKVLWNFEKSSNMPKNLAKNEKSIVHHTFNFAIFPQFWAIFDDISKCSTLKVFETLKNLLSAKEAQN